MDPQLSRRVGRLMTTDAVRALLMESVDRHLAFVDEVSRAESFDTLPAWVQGSSSRASWSSSRIGSATRRDPPANLDRGCGFAVRHPAHY